MGGDVVHEPFQIERLHQRVGKLKFRPARSGAVLFLLRRRNIRNRFVWRRGGDGGSSAVSRVTAKREDDEGPCLERVRAREDPEDKGDREGDGILPSLPASISHSFEAAAGL